MLLKPFCISRKLMRSIPVILLFSLCYCSYGQELDIFQKDSTYAMNKISLRTMYSVQDKEKQKELVTYYNSRGQKVKQYWYWNGEKQFHNVETFIYADNGTLTSLIDSFANGNVEKTNYVYDNNVLKWQATVNQQNDTCDFRLYPGKNIMIKCWYTKGKPYRIDTTIFEKENAKLEYYGSDYSQKIIWHYKFLNQFDSKGNLVSVENPDVSFTSYSYDIRNLLVKKLEQLQLNSKKTLKTEYIFEYQ